MPLVTIGIDLDENVSAIHELDESGKAAPVESRVTHFGQLPITRTAAISTFSLNAAACVRRVR